MARRPFDPAESRAGPRPNTAKATSRSVRRSTRLVADADVVVHLAFVIMGSREESARVNLAGTRNVFEATVAAQRPHRLVYTSSVAAYGYHSDNPVPITEDVPPRGSPEHYYSEQKAACESRAERDRRRLVARNVRVAAVHRRRSQSPRAGGSHAVESIARAPSSESRRRCQYSSRRSRIPAPRLQLVHHDDVATAIALAATTSAPPGAYNLAGDGVVSMSTVAEALGARPVRVPRIAATAASMVVARIPFVPSILEWLHVGRTSVVMDTTKAKDTARVDAETHRRRDLVGAGCSPL